ncbi:MAG TPA: hypothetical protein VGR61_03615, partial [Candidatus Dormibacteraeota bacterium]|nr:hypothetical protein [Candidatus Dormibacteraeota bacterium]
ANGSPARTASGLLYSTNQVTLAGAPGTTSTVPVTVSNTGIFSQDVAPRLRTLGAPTAIASGTVNLSSGSPTFKYQTGADVHYSPPFAFNVDVGTDRLVSRVAWNTSGPMTGSTIRVTLFDPQGRMVAHSRPQGAGGGFGEDEIHNPTFGTWTMLVFTTGGPQYEGPVNYAISEARFQDKPGAVSPASLTLPSGASGTFNITVKTPNSPGDRADSVAFSATYFGSDQAPAAASIPVLLRSDVPVTRATPGHFTGTLTGGNARMAFYGQELTYQFDVPAGAPEINVDVNIPADGYQVFGFLVGPDQSPRDVQSSLDQNAGAPNYRTLHLSWFQPMAGRWTLDFAQINGISSLLTSTSLVGTINFNAAPISASGLPHSTATRLTRGQTSIAHVHVVNNGNSPAYYSIDPRRHDTVELSLSSFFPTSGTLPIGGSFPQFVVPPFSTRLDMAASSTVPIDFSMSPNFGYPEVLSDSNGTDAVATLIAPVIPASAWGCPPTEIGPFATTAPIVPYSCGAVALTRAFDTTVTTSTGNPWSVLEGITADYTPLTLLPGQSGNIAVNIKPTGSVGSVASGTLAVQTYNSSTISSDELKFLPYTYTVR